MTMPGGSGAAGGRGDERGVYVAGGFRRAGPVGEFASLCGKWSGGIGGGAEGGSGIGGIYIIFRGPQLA